VECLLHKKILRKYGKPIGFDKISLYFNNFDKLKFLIATTLPRCIQENFECNLNGKTFQLCITELDDLHYPDFESIEYNMGSFWPLLFEDDDDDDSQNLADSLGEVASAVHDLCLSENSKQRCYLYGHEIQVLI